MFLPIDEEELEEEQTQDYEKIINDSFNDYIDTYIEYNKAIYCGLDYLLHNNNNNNKQPQHKESLQKCFIIPYHIYQNNLQSFVQIMLLKNKKHFLSFFQLDVENDINENTINKSCEFMSKMLTGYCGDNEIINPDFFKSIYKGHYFEKDESKPETENAYIFFDLSSINISNLFINNIELIWFAMADEILNKNKIMDLNICKKVTYFFNKNKYFLKVYSENNSIIPHFPIVAYSYQKKVDKALFVNIFGVSKTNIKNTYCYSLDNYESFANIYDNGYLIRFALFQPIIYSLNEPPSSYLINNEINVNVNDNANVNANANATDKSLNEKYLFKHFYQQVPLTYHNNI